MASAKNDPRLNTPQLMRISLAGTLDVILMKITTGPSRSDPYGETGKEFVYNNIEEALDDVKTRVLTAIEEIREQA